jgi:hypothetical protein
MENVHLAPPASESDKRSTPVNTIRAALKTCDQSIHLCKDTPEFSAGKDEKNMLKEKVSAAGKD